MRAIVFMLFFVIYVPTAKAQAKKADSLYAVGAYTKAITAYDHIENKDVKAITKMAEAYRAIGNYKKAIDHYEKALKKDSSLVQIAITYVKLLQQNNNYKKAERILTGFTKWFDDNPELHYQLGVVRQTREDSTYIDQFRKTIRLNPQHQKALYQSAVYHFKKRAFDEVESLGALALLSYPENDNINLLLARNAYVAKNYRKSAERFEKIRAGDTLEQSDYKKLGFSYYRLHDIEKAIPVFKILKKIDQNDPDAYYNLGMLYNQKGKYKKAQEYFKSALMLKQMGLDDLYKNLGLAYKKEEDHKQAIFYFRKALEKNPQMPRVQFELARAVDNYYEDLQMRLDYYQTVVDKFKDLREAQHYISLSETRIKDLKKEMHSNKE